MTLRAVLEDFSERLISNLVHRIHSSILTLNSDSVDNRALSIPARSRVNGGSVGAQGAYLKPELYPLNL